MKFAMVFPGQGSQSVGMLNAYGDSPAVKEVLAQASTVLSQDIGKLIAEGPAEELNLTVNTQPLMLSVGYAVYRLWQELGGPEPSVVAGHSLGEYPALVVAGAIDFKDALPLVRYRAQIMQEAVPQGYGAMAAVLGADDETVRAACAEAAQDEVVEAVNFNCPGQVVIAGHAGAVARAMVLVKQKGAKRAIQLPVSAPFHSSLLTPAAVRLRDYLHGVKLQAPRIPVIHNVDVSTHDTPAALREALVTQANHPVRWVETIRAMAAMGITQIAECGPGKVLAPLSKRISESVHGMALTDRASIEQSIAALKGN